MLCKEFEELLPIEKTEMVGKIVHAIQSSTEAFKDGQRLIKKAELLGLYEGVTINPLNIEETEKLNQ